MSEDELRRQLGMPTKADLEKYKRQAVIWVIGLGVALMAIGLLLGLLDIAALAWLRDAAIGTGGIMIGEVIFGYVIVRVFKAREHE